MICKQTGKFGFVLTFILLTIATVRSEDFVCHWAAVPLTIDGAADEEAWTRAQVIDGFRIPGAKQAEAIALPKAATRARLLWDRQYLYFYAQLDDHDLFADVIERDGKTWDNDVFEIFLKPGREHTGYYEFQVNAAGTEMDLFLPDKNSGGYSVLKSANTFHMQTKVQRRGTLNERGDRDVGWSVEGRIPWIDFMPTGGRPDVDEKWLMALCRYDYTQDTEPELSSCAPLSKLDFHLVEDYAPLRFASAAESDPVAMTLKNRERFVDSRVIGSPDPPLPFRTVRAFPDLKLDWPVDVQVEPGTRNFIVIVEAGSYGPTLIKRASSLATDAQVAAPDILQLLIDPKGVAYSIAFHPKFAENGFMYIGSNGKIDEKESGGKLHSRIVRYTISRTAPFNIVDEPLTIIDWESGGHNGAAVTFGTDGLMYVTSGDGTSDSDANNVGQDLSKLLAKVLRIDVDQPTAGHAYAVPQDNPFVGVANARPETWAYGLRNPWRITCDPKTGHIWVGNNGQDMYEQAYLIQRGANYGWSVYEGSHPFYMQRKLGPTPHVKPTVEHAHSESRSLTGGVVYHGSNLPDLQGAYIYGDYSTGKIWGVKHDGQKIVWQRELADTTLQISAISLDPDGELIVVDHRGDGLGGLYHLEPMEQTVQPQAFPRKLSETGLFQSVAGHKVSAGMIPYSLNAPFWSDGAIKSRFIGLPQNGLIELTERWAWQLPEQTVLVKSFALEMTAGDPSSQRWIETRLLTKQQGEWIGYSYAWLEDQSDALLVAASGRDQVFVIDDAEVTREQLWRYPSRTECMACHTRAAGFVLGLTTEQMNKVHDFGDGVKVNQLEALETLGVLKTNWLPKAKDGLRTDLKNAGESPAEIERQMNAIKVADGQLNLRSTKLLATPADDFPKLCDPYDPAQDLEGRARAFLHSNCAYCHVEAGGGNSQMDLSKYVSLERMKVVDVKPNHHTFEIADARLIAPGEPERSVLLHRIGIRQPGQMPQLATTLVDDVALQMLRQWVREMKR